MANILLLQALGCEALYFTTKSLCEALYFTTKSLSFSISLPVVRRPMSTDLRQVLTYKVSVPKTTRYAIYFFNSLEIMCKLYSPSTNAFTSSISTLTILRMPWTFGKESLLVCERLYLALPHYIEQSICASFAIHISNSTKIIRLQQYNTTIL